MPTHINSLWFVDFILCFRKLLRFSLNVINIVEANTTSKQIPYPSKIGLFGQFTGRLPFGYSQWSEKVGFFFNLYESNSHMKCLSVLPTFRWILSTIENRDTLQPSSESCCSVNPTAGCTTGCFSKPLNFQKTCVI